MQTKTIPALLTSQRAGIAFQNLPFARPKGQVLESPIEGFMYLPVFLSFTNQEKSIFPTPHQRNKSVSFGTPTCHIVVRSGATPTGYHLSHGFLRKKE
ncbi:MAG: hypothetical protein PUK16_07815 [Prevotellaceae bacterium]|nr:hypothetical protein [Prevotellaceae bacterium]MDY2633284.1 hypothetical protein [Prevotella sp.]